jgi:hemerythrin-like domain-containing protein
MPAVQADITRLTGEHQEADELHAEIAELFTAWIEGQTPSSEDARGLREMTQRLADLYREHIGIEEDSVFPQAARTLDSRALAAIGREFQQRRA